MANPGEHHPAFEEYCECIFELEEDDVGVIQARIAERLQVSRPAVSQHLRVLSDAGLLTVTPIGNRRFYAIAPEGVDQLRNRKFSSSEESEFMTKNSYHYSKLITLPRM